MPNEVDMKLCGAVKLLGAIFGEDQDKLMMRYGIIPPHYVRCMACQKPIGPHQIYFGNKDCHFCSKECRDSHLNTMVACTSCGTLLPRSTSRLLMSIRRRNQQYYFCNNKCKGKWASEHYLPIHGIPRNKHRKYNWDLVWQTHIMTGCGALKLSRMLDIPISSISSILHKKRTEIMAYNPKQYSTTK
jgi:YHS domain-containing protein